jgi:hypothetical protein
MRGWKESAMCLCSFLGMFWPGQVGPRFEMRPFRVMLGTADQVDAEDEWVMRPYMNTARKKDAV